MNIPTSSKLLLSFYKWWLSQDDDNLSDEAYCTGYVGLCASLRHYLYTVKSITDMLERHAISDEMKYQFDAAGLDNGYPFDMCSSFYDSDAEDNRMRKNPRRRAWVAARIADCEKK